MDLAKIIANVHAQAAEIDRLRGALQDQVGDAQGSVCPCCRRSPVSGATWSLLTKQDELLKKFKEGNAERDALLAKCLEAMIDFPPEQCDPGIQDDRLRAQICKLVKTTDPWDGKEWVRDHEDSE